MVMFSACAILYGDHLPLARKLLESLRVNAHVGNIRLGLNAVSNETRRYVHTWASDQQGAQPVFIFEPEDNKNVGKYPLMRQMFRYGELADRIMWFDDDSYVDPMAGIEWWNAANSISKGQIQVGAVHTIMQRDQQHTVIALQPWYTGKPINARHRFKFVTGGWWIGDTGFIVKWGYPFAALYHNGGDSILGELIRQQGKQLGQFHRGLQCHCESCAKKGISLDRPVVHINVGGRKGRRGIGVRDEKYIWADGNPATSQAHQNFDLKVYRYED
jgi:hypothetical protein